MLFYPLYMYCNLEYLKIKWAEGGWEGRNLLPFPAIIVNTAFQLQSCHSTLHDTIVIHTFSKQIKFSKMLWGINHFVGTKLTTLCVLPYIICSLIFNLFLKWKANYRVRLFKKCIPQLTKGFWGLIDFSWVNLHKYN